MHKLSRRKKVSVRQSDAVNNKKENKKEQKAKKKEEEKEQNKLGSRKALQSHKTL